MAMLHEPAVRTSLESRLNALRPDASRKWGSMTPDQMLWHVNQFLEFALGDTRVAPSKSPMPLPIMRFMILNLPWPKSAPTNPNAKAAGTHDFAAERARCLTLIDRFTKRPLEGAWPVDPTFGVVSGRFQSRLQAKHLNHHLRQFGG